MRETTLEQRRENDEQRVLLRVLRDRPKLRTRLRTVGTRGSAD